MTEQEIIKRVHLHGETMTEDEALSIIAICTELQLYHETGLTPQMVKDLIKSEKEAHKVALENAQIVDEYRAIGTVEECRDAVEKQTAKKPKKMLGSYDGVCECGKHIFDCDKFCYECGQKVDWSK